MAAWTLPNITVGRRFCIWDDLISKKNTEEQFGGRKEEKKESKPVKHMKENTNVTFAMPSRSDTF